MVRDQAVDLRLYNFTGQLWAVPRCSRCWSGMRW